MVLFFYCLLLFVYCLYIACIVSIVCIVKSIVLTHCFTYCCYCYLLFQNIVIKHCLSIVHFIFQDIVNHFMYIVGIVFCIVSRLLLRYCSSYCF